MKEKPKVTVVTVCYNCHDVIEPTIRNVLKQTYPNLEYIIIDGNSTDGTREVVERYAPHLAYWTSEPDAGIYDAMNKGIRAATGQWIIFRNAGDYFFKPSTIADVFAWYVDKGEAIITGGMRSFCSEGYRDKFYHQDKTDVWNKAFFPHPSAFIRMNVQKAHPYSTSFRIASDYHFFQTLMLESASFICYPEIVALFDGSNGISSTQLPLSWKEILEVRKQLGAPRWVVKETKKKYLHVKLTAFIIGILRRNKRLFGIYHRKRQLAGWTLQPLSLTLKEI